MVSREIEGLTVRNLSKSFSGQRALDDVSMSFPFGSVTALLGENGSGKSTAIKVLAGFYEPTGPAHLEVGGESAELPIDARDANRLGLRFVHQDLALVQDMTVAENFGVGNGFGQKRLLGRISWRAEEKRVGAAVAALGVSIRPRELVRDLSPARQAVIAIARALEASGGRAGAPAQARALLLDEPTAALAQEERELLFAAISEVRQRGIAVVFVTHRLDEVFTVADRVVVLRDGQVALTGLVTDLDEQALVQAIVGRELEAHFGNAESDGPEENDREAALRIDRLSGKRLRDLSFQIRQGEIVGVAGLMGSGRSELARLAAGVDRPAGGEIRVRGATLPEGPFRAIRRGVIYVPEDRRGQGMIPTMTLRANVTLPSLGRFWKRGILRQKEERAVAKETAQLFNVRPPDTERPLSQFSGGNQQKAILGKWLRLNPHVIVLDEPTQGIDVGSKQEVMTLIREQAEAGIGVLLISSDFEELAHVSHRVLVLRDGRLVAEVRRPHVTVQRLVALCQASERTVAGA